jgi:copper transport protein
MASISTSARRGILAGLLAAILGVLLASPASAHAELVSSTPANGAQLDQAPATVQMRFTEAVNLIPGGIRLVDDKGTTVRTSEPAVAGHTVTWRMPADLSEGSYVVSWRVVSSDGHPVAGAFSFGIGTPALAVAGTSPTAPLPVVVARLAGYLAFALFAGVVAFVLWCSPESRTHPTLQRLVRAGLLGGALATVCGLLVQGPYIAGVGMSRLLDPALLRETLATPFGSAMAARLALYAGLAALAWRLPTITVGYRRWLTPAGIVAVAVAIAGAGHGAASGRPLDLGIDALHALTAGIWVGGLVALTVLGRDVPPLALRRFSTLAMGSVLALVGTGTLNSLAQIKNPADLFLTRYGLVLLLKLGVVALALAGAAVSRRRLREGGVPLISVRYEAGLTAGVLAVTAVLSMTAPPSQLVIPTDDATAVRSTSASGPATRTVVNMSLGTRGRATLKVFRPGTGGSQLQVFLTDAQGRPLDSGGVDLKVSNPGRDLAPIPVPMTQWNGGWSADYRFPLPGVWKATLTVQTPDHTGVVTAGNVTISN